MKKNIKIIIANNGELELNLALIFNKKKRKKFLLSATLWYVRKIGVFANFSYNVHTSFYSLIYNLFYGSHIKRRVKPEKIQKYQSQISVLHCRMKLFTLVLKSTSSKYIILTIKK